MATALPDRIKPLAGTIVALLALTVASFGASRLGLGVLETPVALGIAVAKAGLVAWVFMEMPHASLPARVVALVTISFIALLCAGTVADVAFR